jgi:hypothetical protein
VDEGVGITELQLEGGTHVVEAHHLPELLDDPEPSLNPAPVVIRDFEDEEILERFTVNRHVPVAPWSL